MEGYAKLGLFMGLQPEYAIFKAFAGLNAQNILYLQAELYHLEQELLRYAAADTASCHPARSRYKTDWLRLANSIGPSATAGENKRQWETFLKIRVKLGEYNKAILEQKEMAKMLQPEWKDFRDLQLVMNRSDLGDIFLDGQDSMIWSDTNFDDLIVLRDRVKNDTFSDWVEQSLSIWWRRLRRETQKMDDPLVGKGEFIVSKKYARVTKAFTTVLAGLLPVLAIVVLQFIKSAAGRLGAIATLTGLFTLTLDVFTNARRVDIFMATSAFAAVQVVFVGSAILQDSKYSS